jgi:hypothetical protein
VSKTKQVKHALTMEEAEEAERVARELDHDPDGLGVIFRVANARNRKLGRLSVFMAECGAMKIHSKGVAQSIANAVQGKVIPYTTAERMGRKKDRRIMGWELPWILHDLPRRPR